MIQSFHCCLTTGQFAAGYRDRSEPRHSIAQNNDLAFRLFLLQSLGSSHWPFAYDDWSGDAEITAILSLRDVWSFPVVTLASSAPCTVIPNGFSGLLHTNTQEVADFITSSGSIARAEREAMLMVDLVNASGEKLNPFRHPVLLTATAATDGAVPVLAGTILYLSEVTQYLGGTATDLDGQRTIGRLGYIFQAVINGILVSWRVEAGTAETDLDLGIIKPADFDADDNAVNLIRVGGI